MKSTEKFVLEHIQPDRRQKERILRQIAQAVEEKQELYCPSGWEIFCGQVKYISRFCLGGQLLCLFLIMVLFAYFQWKGENMLAYLGAASAAASCMSVFLILELNRSSTIGMLELEQSCYLNVKQVWCMKMILFGCLDILFFSIMIPGIAGTASCGMFQVMVYLLVPFVISSFMQLLVFTMLRGGKREYLQAGMAVGCGMASLLPLSAPEWYTMAYFGIWLLLLAAFGLSLAWEIRQLYHKLEEGELICWN
ncbi:hypothetical protein VSQ32_12610 [Lachnospiraceae bacterium KK002]